MFPFAPEPSEKNVALGPARRIAFVGARLIDGTGRETVPDAAVVVEDGVVSAAGPRSRVKMPAGVEVVDVSDRWITPGLIDCHVHLAGETSFDMYSRYLAPSRELKLLNAVRHAYLALSSGFTTVRNVGRGFGIALRQAVAEGLIVGPRIVTAAGSLTSTGGHGDWAIFPYEWFKSMGARGTIVDGPDECRLAVRLAFREGADLIKVTVNAGGVTNHAHDMESHPEFSPEELRVIVEETHRRAAKVAAHAVGPNAVQMAVQAGADTIEHGVFEPDQALLSRMAETKITLVPTLLIFRWTADEGKRAGVFDQGIERAKRLLDTQYRMVKAAYDAGVNVALGTDNTGVMGPGRSARELTLLCEAGLTPSQALQAGTRNAAVACGIGDRVGTIEKGRSADMLILKKDPLRDISCMENPETIERVVRGRI